MKAFTLILLSGAFLLSSVSATTYAGEVDQSVTEHLAKTASYEEKAKIQEAVIADHQKQKESYRRRYYINDKVTPHWLFARVEKEHDEIIKKAMRLRDEYLDFAKWHRMRAAELKGQ